MSIDTAIALIRFGLGAKPGEMEQTAISPQAWLKQQITPSAALMPKGGLLTTKDAVNAFAVVREKQRSSDAKIKEMASLERKALRETLRGEIKARIIHSTTTQAPFAQRWVDFWCNHFTVAATRPETVALVGPFEREAIRPHVFGPFKTLLQASTLHPAMLSYLDNHRSIGQSSPIGKRRKRSLNENLAREVLELHTLGVGGGYSQKDVESFAMALTGWVPSFLRQLKGEVDTPTTFFKPIHEPRSKTLLGRKFADSGADQAKEMLDMLASQDATARHIAFKLARHFIADAPPPNAVEALAQSFLSTDGDLSAVATTLIELEEGWMPTLAKVKTPIELIISAGRGLETQRAFNRVNSAFKSLAQRPYRAPSPAGWPDEAAAWISPDALKKRVEWANLIAQRAMVPPSKFVDTALGPLANSALRTAISRAESPAQGLTLALMSPPFQRR